MEFADFKGNKLLMKPIVEDAKVYPCSDEYSWNNSTILTELIHAAGRWCERYASDLFIDWEIVEKDIASGYENPSESHCYLFGFRKDGVDNAAYIFARAKDIKIQYVSELDRYYRAMYKLTVIEMEERREMKIVLERVF